LRNLFSFYRALTTNTLWRVLMVGGIWQHVIKDKYLPYGSVTRWLRSTECMVPQGSQTWRTLQKSIPLLLHWIAWNPGSGHSIIIGKDSILGLGSKVFLFDDLIESLNLKDVHYLYQASRVLCQGTIFAPIGLTTRI